MLDIGDLSTVGVPAGGTARWWWRAGRGRYRLPALFARDASEAIRLSPLPTRTGSSADALAELTRLGRLG